MSSSCYQAMVACMQKASKSPLSCNIKAAISDWRPLTDVFGPHWVKTPSLCGRSSWQQQHIAPQWLRSISSCMCFVGVSWTAVDLQIDFNSWNENRWLIGHGCIVDSWAVNKWSVAGASDSEWVPRAGDPHHTSLIDNCNPILTATIFCCQSREV